MFYTNLRTDDLQVISLASGSSGNAMLVQSGDTHILIDAGLPLRQLSTALTRRGVRPGNLDAILLTHEHQDHVCGAGPLSRWSSAPLIANASTLAAYSERDMLPFPTKELPTHGAIGIGCLGIRSFPVPHDAREAVGFVIEAGIFRIVYFTDAGSVNDAMRTAMRGASLAIVEANHDIEWLWRGPYSDAMKERVASPIGHLSNADCADLLAERLEEEGALSVWLAHLSRVNNSPSLAKRSVRERVATKTRVPMALEVALRDQPSVMWKAGASAVQLALL